MRILLTAYGPLRKVPVNITGQVCSDYNIARGEDVRGSRRAGGLMIERNEPPVHTLNTHTISK